MKKAEVKSNIIYEFKKNMDYLYDNIIKNGSNTMPFYVQFHLDDALNNIKKSLTELANEIKSEFFTVIHNHLRKK